MSNSDNKIGDKIKDIRLNQGLTQYELAKRSGVSREHIVTIEKNNCSSSKVIIGRIALGLGITVNTLMPNNITEKVKKNNNLPNCFILFNFIKPHIMKNISNYFKGFILDDELINEFCMYDFILKNSVNNNCKLFIEFVTSRQLNSDKLNQILNFATTITNQKKEFEIEFMILVDDINLDYNIINRFNLLKSIKIQKIIFNYDISLQNI